MLTNFTYLNIVYLIGLLVVVDASAPVGAVGGKLEDGQGPGSCCSEIHDVGPRGPDVDLGSRRHPEPQGPEGTDHGPYSVSTDSPAKYEYYYEGKGEKPARKINEWGLIMFSHKQYISLQE